MSFDVLPCKYFTKPAQQNSGDSCSDSKGANYSGSKTAAAAAIVARHTHKFSNPSYKLLWMMYDEPHIVTRSLTLATL